VDRPSKRLPDVVLILLEAMNRGCVRASLQIRRRRLRNRGEVARMAKADVLEFVAPL